MYGLVKKYIGDGDMPAVIKDPSELIKSVVSYSENRRIIATASVDNNSTRKRGAQRKKNCGFC